MSDSLGQYRGNYDARMIWLDYRSRDGRRRRETGRHAVSYVHLQSPNSRFPGLYIVIERRIVLDRSGRRGTSNEVVPTSAR